MRQGEEIDEIRRNWMGLYGMSEEDIEEACLLSPPTDEADESAQLEAMKTIVGLRQ